LLPNHHETFLDVECNDTELNEKEVEAHSFAKHCFIEDSVWHEFFAKNSSFNYFTTEDNMKYLADKLKIHPSIVFGRYCFEAHQFAIKTSIDRTIK
jgi:HTH-type transcriptional regulator/antitoxin HigA